MEKENKQQLLNQGVIGNGRVLALISPTSAIEWLCMPRFDSPSVFGRLLDRDKGGTFRFLFKGEEITGQQQYIANTNVLLTKFEHGDFIWELVDFSPRIPKGLTVTVPIQVIRIVRPVRGQPVLQVDFNPKPDYALQTVDLVQFTQGIEFKPFYLNSNLPMPYILNKCNFVLDRAYFFVFSYGSCAEDTTMASVEHDLEVTIAGWRQWAKTCALPTFAADKVLRSALCLKLHVYHDTGAIIAAATTSIPEAMNTPRTWDYRYCWLRDAAFVVEALRRLSHLSEGEQFIHFLRDVAESGSLQPLYGIDGRRDLQEKMLPHLSGFNGNGYVRIGNAASLQVQNDLMGELVLCLETLLSDTRIVDCEPNSFFKLIEFLVEEAIRVAPMKDTGIWEFRSMLRHYTFSRAMCWVAVNRGVDLARKFGFRHLLERWQQIAVTEHEIVLSRGYNSKLGFFTQSLDGEFPDAANLLFPTLGIIDAKDKRFISTVEAYQKLLVEQGLMLRYRNPDDFGETTSAFTICSFWWVEALALIGRLDEAIELFNQLLGYSNSVGLFSEDIDPKTGILLGNFPQAYTHVGLIHAAMTIG
ncbi:MAG: glycoside hydrolase family 15 protein, partial [Blastocatellia bacterium]|nr:glycoside hydrolase family 15 protein [Blastocatellia bacterium]